MSASTATEQGVPYTTYSVTLPPTGIAVSTATTVDTRATTIYNTECVHSIPTPTCSIDGEDCRSLFASWSPGGTRGRPPCTVEAATNPCDDCVLYIPSVKLMYFPVSMTGNICGNYSTVSPVHRGNYTLPTTVDVSGTTYTSGYAYLSYAGVTATGGAGTCGAPKPAGVLALRTKDVFSYRGHDAAMSANGDVHWPFNFADLTPNQVPWDAWISQETCYTHQSYPECQTITQAAYRPWIVYPREFWAMEPLWSKCGSGIFGIMDPPTALPLATAVALPSRPAIQTTSIALPGPGQQSSIARQTAVPGPSSTMQMLTSSTQVDPEHTSIEQPVSTSATGNRNEAPTLIPSAELKSSSTPPAIAETSTRVGGFPVSIPTADASQPVSATTIGSHVATTTDVVPFNLSTASTDSAPTLSTSTDSQAHQSAASTAGTDDGGTTTDPVAKSQSAALNALSVLSAALSNQEPGPTATASPAVSSAQESEPQSTSVASSIGYPRDTTSHLANPPSPTSGSIQNSGMFTADGPDVLTFSIAASLAFVIDPEASSDLQASVSLATKSILFTVVPVSSSTRPDGGLLLAAGSSTITAFAVQPTSISGVAESTSATLDHLTSSNGEAGSDPGVTEGSTPDYQIPATSSQSWISPSLSYAMTTSIAETTSSLSQTLPQLVTSIATPATGSSTASNALTSTVSSSGCQAFSVRTIMITLTGALLFTLVLDSFQ